MDGVCVCGGSGGWGGIGCSGRSWRLIVTVPPTRETLEKTILSTGNWTCIKTWAFSQTAFSRLNHGSVIITLLNITWSRLPSLATNKKHSQVIFTKITRRLSLGTFPFQTPIRCHLGRFLPTMSTHNSTPFICNICLEPPAPTQTQHPGNQACTTHNQLLQHNSALVLRLSHHPPSLRPCLKALVK